MNRSEYRQAKRIFLEACDKEPERRASYVEDACQGDAVLLATVRKLLVHDEGPVDFADDGLVQSVLGKIFEEENSQDLAWSEQISAPTKIGSYRIVERIGAGAAGVIFLAEQEQPRRKVALKLLSAGLAVPEMLRRFQYEAEILARLNHVGIAHIYESGTFDTGTCRQPFFAMEFVDGLPLCEHSERHGFGARQRLELLVRICDAVEYAHQKGVIHRDLNPRNILVDRHGQPKILDFGVARITDSDVRKATRHTAIGQLLGTVLYMSPEQTLGDSDQIDTLSDVYSLGVVCYELLAGRLPYAIDEKMIHEAVRAIQEEIPPRLSTIESEFCGDLEAIVAKALDKDKSRRYQSASEFAADIRRYLNHESVNARLPSRWYQMRRFARRNVVLVGCAAAVILVLLTGIVAMTKFAFEERAVRRSAGRDRDRAIEAERLAAVRLAEVTITKRELEGARDEAERKMYITAAVNQFFNEALLGAIQLARQIGREATVAEVAELASRNIEGRFDGEPLVESAIRTTLGNTFASLGKFDRAVAQLEIALRLRVGELGEYHTLSLSTLNDLAVAYARHGGPEAEDVGRRAVEGFAAALGEDAPDTVIATGNLAMILHGKGQSREAESLLVEVLMFLRKTAGYGDEHPETLVTMNNLATIQVSLGRYAEARELLVEMLDVHRRNHGEKHPVTLSAAHNLGAVHEKLGRDCEAESH